MLPKLLELASNPLHDIHPTLVSHPACHLLISYMRSAEAIALNEYNQDAFAVWANDSRLVATVADGVGQSFRGDIAAMAIVQSISRILWENDITDPSLDQLISAELTVLSPKVQELLRSIDISHHPVMFRDALELRRQLGSESVFAACAVDWQSQTVYLCWLGDCRIRLYDRQQKSILLDQQLFRTTERWSSQRVLVGDVHSLRLPLATIQRVIIYSDGLHILDKESLDCTHMSGLVHDAVEHSLALPESDDITLVTFDVHKVT